MNVEDSNLQSIAYQLNVGYKLLNCIGFWNPKPKPFICEQNTQLWLIVTYYTTNSLTVVTFTPHFRSEIIFIS